LLTAFTNQVKPPTAAISIPTGMYRLSKQILLSIELGLPFECGGLDWRVHFVEWVHRVLEQRNNLRNFIKSKVAMSEQKNQYHTLSGNWFSTGFTSSLLAVCNAQHNKQPSMAYVLTISTEKQKLNLSQS
jgi:hypothetical protein